MKKNMNAKNTKYLLNITYSIIQYPNNNNRSFTEKQTNSQANDKRIPFCEMLLVCPNDIFQPVTKDLQYAVTSSSAFVTSSGSNSKVFGLCLFSFHCQFRRPCTKWGITYIDGILNLNPPKLLSAV